MSLELRVHANGMEPDGEQTQEDSRCMRSLQSANSRDGRVATTQRRGRDGDEVVAGWKLLQKGVWGESVDKPAVL